MNAVKDYFAAADTEVGRMIEGHYGWTEWCPKHATEFLTNHPEARNRAIDVHEVVTSWRDYKCYRCHKELWSRKNVDGEPAIKDPFASPAPGIIVELPTT